MARYYRVIIFIIAAAAVILTGCGSTTARAPRQYDNRMKFAGNSHGMHVWIDTETGICYAERDLGGITILINHDGTPFIANGWRDYAE